MYGIYAKYRATDIYAIFVAISLMLVIFLVFQTYIKPFKNKLVNYLDSGLVINLTIINLFSWYSQEGSINDENNLLYLFFSDIYDNSCYHILSCTLGYRKIEHCKKTV